MRRRTPAPHLIYPRAMDLRFRKLEEHLTFVEHQVGELDTAVRDLGDSLGRTATHLERLARRVSALEQAGGDDSGGDAAPDPAADKPPHW